LPLFLLSPKMNKAYIIFLLTATGLFAFLAQGIYFPLNKDQTETQEIMIEKGQGGKEIAKILQEREIIKWAPFFRIYVLTMGHQGSLKAGRYELSPSMNIPEIAEKMIKGIVVRKKIIIVEGWNLRDIGRYLENKEVVQAEEFFGLAGDHSKAANLLKQGDFEYPFLSDKPDNLGLEGYLFPDTYEILPGEGAEGLIARALDNFNKKVCQKLKEEINSQEKTLFEIITMASLIEKEVREEEDKRLVSGLLWKRIEAGMPLQVDATIAYLTGKRTTKVSKEETQIDSPFNTYKYKGLPAGPICNPGLESIRASLNPQESPYWYYLSTPEGKTIFSRNLQEHNAAKAKYLK